MTVDEEGRCAEPAHTVGFGHVGVDGAFPGSQIEHLREPVHVQSDVPRVLDQELALNLRLTCEDLVVKFPELALLERRNGCEMLKRRVFMDAQRVVLPDDPDFVAVYLADLIECRTDPCAERSLEVRELGECVVY